MDVHDRETRSRNMRAIKNKDTKPELIVRHLLHRNGFRYRIAPNYLPGKPDLWLAKWRAAIFINGCFWHGHDCALFRLPSTRTQFWKKKINSNKERDKRNINLLNDKRIRVLTIWECALKGKCKMSEDTLLTLFKTWLYCGTKCSEINADSLIISVQIN